MREFEDLYRTYFTDVFLYILRLSGNEHIAEEITSETFCKAMQSINSFRGDCDIRVWLCQIAKNSYYTYWKKAGKTDSLEDMDLNNIPSQEETTEEQLARKAETMRIQKILHSMPDPYREVFMWRVFADLSFQQIGDIFHKSDNWACVTYHRARKMIKCRLEEISHEKRV